MASTLGVVMEKLSFFGEHPEHPELIHGGLVKCDL